MARLKTLTKIEGIRRQRDSARRTREAAASRLSADTLAQDVGPLGPWIERASRGKLHDPEHLAPVIEQFAAIARGETVEVTVSLPPRHGKTTLVIYAIVWLLFKRPDMQILYVSYAHGFAVKQVRRMKMIALEMGLPLGQVRKGGEWTTAAGGGVKACGIGGQVLGEGFHLIVMDDLHKNRAECESDVIREAVCDSVRDDIYTRQHPDGTSVIGVGTRWHTRDYIGQLTAESDDPDAPRPFDCINLPALNDAGEALAPRLFEAFRLDAIRRRIGPHAFASLYQGRPTPKGGALFGPAVYSRGPAPMAGKLYTMGVDIARTAKRRSDHHASVVLCLSEGIVHIVDIIYERGLIHDRTTAGTVEPGITRRMHAQQRRFGNCPAAQHTGRDEQSVLDGLARDREWPVYVKGIVAKEGKYLRAQAVAAQWNLGKIRIVEGIAHALELVAQATHFTGIDGDADDIIDALVSAFALLPPLEQSPPPPPPKARPERRIATSAARARYT